MDVFIEFNAADLARKAAESALATLGFNWNNGCPVLVAPGNGVAAAGRCTFVFNLTICAA